MPAQDRVITREDILPLDQYEAERARRRPALIASKKNRRVEVGPHATFYFESYDTMWWQIHEMLRIEKGGEEQIADELSAYNPLIPQGSDLSATIMFEIEDPLRRKAVLGRLGGVEETIFLDIAGEKVRAEAEQDVDRTTADGKASSVHFLHFHMTPQQIAAFKDPAVQVILGIEHESYAHMTVVQPSVREELAKDFAS
jgi:hypothetical protein